MCFISFQTEGIETTNQLAGGFKYFLFSSLFGEDFILTNVFEMGWNHQLVSDWGDWNHQVYNLERIDGTTPISLDLS